MKSLPLFIGLMLVNISCFGQTFTPATATADIYNGFVVGVTVNNAGAGYAYPPGVTFGGGGGSGAGAYSIITNGSVSQIIVTNAGSGYVSAPSVVIASPGNYSFSSGGAYITVPDSASLDSTTNQLTVECWFNRSVSQSDWNVLASKDPSGFASYNYELRFNPNNQPVATFHITPSLPSGDLTYSRPPTYPAWHHYAMQFDATNCSVWLDGNIVYSTNTPGIIIPIGSYPLSIGCQNSGMRPFVGFIDEVRISKIARYHSAFNPQLRFSPDTNTVALYHFDEGSGATVHDSSGNGNNGTISGSSAWSTNIPVVSAVSVNILKAVYLSFSNLTVGTNYQIQVSTNLYGGSWNNFGTPFTATSPSMSYSNYWNVNDWNQMYFRLSP